MVGGRRVRSHGGMGAAAMAAPVPLVAASGCLVTATEEAIVLKAVPGGGIPRFLPDANTHLQYPRTFSVNSVEITCDLLGIATGTGPNVAVETPLCRGLVLFARTTAPGDGFPFNVW